MGISINLRGVDSNILSKCLICGLFLPGEVVALEGAQHKPQVFGEGEE
jgi:hypothetical protein